MRRFVLAVALALAVPAFAQTAPPPVPPALRGPHFLVPDKDELAGLRAARERMGPIREAIDAIRKRRGLPPLDLAALARTRVPVLAVAGEHFANAEIHATRDHFVLTAGNATYGLVLTGTRVAFSLPHALANHPLEQRLKAIFDKQRAAGGLFDPVKDVAVTETDDGVDVSFRRFGMLYDLRLSCAEKDADGCTPDTAMKLLASTRLVGGGS